MVLLATHSKNGFVVFGFIDLLLLTLRPSHNWNHEDMSLKMIEYLVEDNQLDYEKDEIRFIQDLIEGHPTGFSSSINSQRNEGKTILVSNSCKRKK